MSPARTAFLRDVIAAKAESHGKQLTGPAGEALLQAADAIRELAAESDDLAALRIEHKAVCGLLTHTRKDRDDQRKRADSLALAYREAQGESDALRAQVADLQRLGASIHKAADAARRAERADVVAWLHTDGPALAFASCIGRSEYTCAADAIGRGEHEGAASPK